ncbi:hypothetical protein V8E53_002473 [Lactarius tabidus]
MPTAIPSRFLQLGPCLCIAFLKFHGPEIPEHIYYYNLKRAIYLGGFPTNDEDVRFLDILQVDSQAAVANATAIPKRLSIGRKHHGSRNEKHIGQRDNSVSPGRRIEEAAISTVFAAQFEARGSSARDILLQSTVMCNPGFRRKSVGCAAVRDSERGTWREFSSQEMAMSMEPGGPDMEERETSLCRRTGATGSCNIGGQVVDHAFPEPWKLYQRRKWGENPEEKVATVGDAERGTVLNDGVRDTPGVEGNGSNEGRGLHKASVDMISYTLS